MFMAIGCTRTVFQPVQVEKSVIDSAAANADTINANFHALLNELHRSVNVRDSVIIRDSVIMVVNESGGIISRETFRSRDRNRSENDVILQVQSKYDSIFQSQRNEFNAIIKQLEQTPVTVEKQLTKWQSIKHETGGIAIGIIVVLMIVMISKIAKKIF